MCMYHFYQFREHGDRMHSPTRGKALICMYAFSSFILICCVLLRVQETWCVKVTLLAPLWPQVDCFTLLSPNRSGSGGGQSPNIARMEVLASQSLIVHSFTVPKEAPSSVETLLCLCNARFFSQNCQIHVSVSQAVLSLPG